MNMDGILHPLRKFNRKHVTALMNWDIEDGIPAAIFGTLIGYNRNWIYVKREDGNDIAVNIKYITYIALGNHLAELEVKIESENKK